MGHSVTADLRRSRGAYFTARDAARRLAADVLRAGARSVLDPAAGDGVFVAALADVATAMGVRDVSVTAVEFDNDCYGTLLSKFPDTVNATGVCGDFLATRPAPYDAVIGNPPYVRLRNLPVAQRQRALDVAGDCLGHAMEPSGSVWMPFVLHASRSVRDGGCMALVLPYEFTHVRYARPLWEYLARNFGSLRVARSYERVFPDVLQDVVFLLAAEKGHSTATVTYEVFDTVADLVAGAGAATSVFGVRDVLTARPFASSLLPDEARTVLDKFRDITCPVGDMVRFSVGYVSGDKDFFHPTRTNIDAYQIRPQSLLPAVRGARWLLGAGLFTSGLPDKAKTQLFAPAPGELTLGERRYIGEGANAGVSGRYKCRTRDPWYRIRPVHLPDLIVPTFADMPVLCVNDSDLAASNSFLCGTVVGDVSATRFVGSWYTTLTLLSVELCVHSLGGGVLAFTPGEAATVRIVEPRLLDKVDLSLVDSRLRSRDTRSAYEVGDAILRSTGVLSGAELDAVAEAGRLLRRWRLRRP